MSNDYRDRNNGWGDHAKAERLAGLEADVDARLAELWLMAWERGTSIAEAMGLSQDLADQVGALLRAAYGRGYCDALIEEKKGRRGELAKAHGYLSP